MVVDTLALNGADASIYMRGNDGSKGGDAGSVSVVSLKESISSISSNGGAGGLASAIFCQQPGKGAELSKLKYSTHKVMAGYKVVCAKRDRNLANERYMYFCSSSEVGRRMSLDFKIGKDRET